jgi:thiamine monophosphate synthase
MRHFTGTQLQHRRPVVGAAATDYDWVVLVSDGPTCRGDLELILTVRRPPRRLIMRRIVNDRADIALLSGAGGVHVGQDDLPVEGVRLVRSPCGLSVRATRVDR